MLDSITTAVPAADTSALAVWVDEAQWLLRSLLLLLLLILDQEAWNAKRESVEMTRAT